LSRTQRSEAIVLRSFRYGEADRIVHLLTREQGRVGAISKGVRRTRSKLGGRLEPLSRIAVLLHRGTGELYTVTGADLIESFDPVRADPRRLGIALVGIEAVVRLFPEEAAPNERLFDGLVRFLEVVERLPVDAPAGDPSTDPLTLAFCLKLIALAGWAPRLDACASCGAPGPLTGYSVTAGGAVCSTCTGFPIAAATLPALGALLGRPLEEAPRVDGVALRQVRRIVDETVAEHAGGRLRTFS
jgi:DNA repair protein RecO (recombination protein O)